MDIKKLDDILIQSNQPKFRRQQLLLFYFQNKPESWNDFSNLPKDLRQMLATKLPLSTVIIDHVTESSDTTKFLIRLSDSADLVEAVTMKHGERTTLCLSCQSGCPLGCQFCATGTMKVTRNLSASEIIDTVKAVANYLAARHSEISNIVYMGMGEPFLNYDAVKESLILLHDYWPIGWRKISVSTAGIVPRLAKFANDFPQVNLAISLNAAEDEKRSELMPVNDQYPLTQLMPACKKYVQRTKRKLFFEYIVIPGFNDSRDDARQLKKLLNHPLFHLNIIKFHKSDAVACKNNIKWPSASSKQMMAFKKLLELEKIPFTQRRSFGESINAACGMLVASKTNTV
ncbi:MAG: 23S rRNA (adenine(2503)-C(2))-methyltransferase RlmN [Patescibacteria group bacterium]